FAFAPRRWLRFAGRLRQIHAGAVDGRDLDGSARHFLPGRPDVERALAWPGDGCGNPYQEILEPASDRRDWPPGLDRSGKPNDPVARDMQHHGHRIDDDFDR